MVPLKEILFDKYIQFFVFKISLFQIENMKQVFGVF